MCCLFGIYDYGHSLTAAQKKRLVSALAVASEDRGTDATGIAYNHNGHLTVYKRPYPAHLMRFKLPDDALCVMGHTRMTTQGDEKHNYNNHPFEGTAGIPFALAHNGVLYNDQGQKAASYPNRDRQLCGRTVTGTAGRSEFPEHPQCRRTPQRYADAVCFGQ